MYRLVPDAATLDQVAALPVDALLAYADVLAVLELKPWAGESHHAAPSVLEPLRRSERPLRGPSARSAR